jgi:predicted secreted protein
MKRETTSRRNFLKHSAIALGAIAVSNIGRISSAAQVIENPAMPNSPEFQDARSKKVMIVAHCILNQNARISTCASFPSALPEIPGYLIQQQIGIIQWPCPELNFLGLGRQGQDCRNWTGSYHHENGEVYDQMTVPEGRQYLRNVAENLVYQIKEYQKYGFRVLGILGINGSPTCGVDMTYYEGLKIGKGAFIEELIKTLEANGLQLTIRGMSDDSSRRNLALIDMLAGD